MKFNERSAYHETGHIVVAYFSGLPILCVKTKPAGSRVEAITLLDGEITPAILAAGNVAQSILGGQVLEDYGALKDFGKLQDIMPPEDVAKVWWEVHKVLSDNWGMVKAVATRLIGHREVGRSELYKVLKKEWV